MAKQQIDVYQQWLKIEATNRPLNYYQLLKLKPFEDDLQVIRKHYRQLNAHIRKYATGDYIEESQNLLNELAKAMLCLTDSERKAEYDFSIGRKSAESETAGRRTFVEILTADRILSPEQLKKAERFADAVGLDLQMAILQQKLAEPEQVMVAYAESEGLSFINLDDFPVDEYYAPQIDPNMARTHSFVPVMADMGKLILASPAPLDLDVETELQTLFEMPVRSAICLPAQVNAAIAKYYPRDAVQVVVAKGKDKGAAVSAIKETAAAGKGTETPVAKPVKEKKKPAERKKPLSAAAKSRRLKLSAIVFNFGFMAACFGRNLMTKGLPMSSLILSGIIVGLIASGITWMATSKEIESEEEKQ